MSGSFFNVCDYGAKGDGIAKDTAAIQSAIDAASAAGGGIVTVPPGLYISGSIFLKSNIELYIQSGAVIKASPDIADYNNADVCPQNAASPKNGDNTTGGHLILCINQKNVTLRGEGKIDGNSPAFLLDKEGCHFPSKKAIEVRPSTMLWFVDSEHISIRNLELADSPYWSCFILNCTHVAVSGCYIHTSRSPHTYNGDGLDIDRCQYVTVSDCRIDTADDCITLRASYGRLLSLPQDCAFVTITNCVLSSSCNAIRLGVGEGNVHHAVFSNLIIRDSNTAFNFVAAYVSTSRGTDITDIRVSNVIVEAERFCRIHHMHSDDANMDNIYFSDISGTTTKNSCIYAVSKTPFGKIVFSNLDLNSGFIAVNAPKIEVVGGSFKEVELSNDERRKLIEGVDTRQVRLH